jgi:uncharacterized Zn-binding protein involved in type VI secretion
VRRLGGLHAEGLPAQRHHDRHREAGRRQGGRARRSVDPGAAAQGSRTGAADRPPLVRAAVIALPYLLLWRDTANPCPSGTVTSGGSDVTVEGKQAGRAGDGAGCAGTITEGSPDVFINGKPAAVQGSKTGCGGAVASGATGVFVNGKPFVIAGSTADCPDK